MYDTRCWVWFSSRSNYSFKCFLFEGELLTASQSVVSMLRQVGIVLAVAIFVSNLTHNLTVNKENVYRYAEEKVRNIHVGNTQQAEILQMTKEK